MSDNEVILAKVAAALQVQRALEEKQNILRGYFEEWSTRDLWKDVRDHLSRVQAYLHSLQPPIPVSSQPTPRSPTLFQEISNIPELMEKVLALLEISDLLVAMRVNRQIAAVVAGSPSLQEKLFLRPSKTGHVCSAFDGQFSFPGTDIRGSRTFADLQTQFVIQDNRLGTSYGSPNEPCYMIRAAFGGPFRQLPRIGMLCRQMLICQPPIRRMKISTNCCSRTRFGSIDDDVVRFMEQNTGNYGMKEIRSDTGITVGDLYDATVRLRQAHQSCPFAAPEHHDYDGTVQVKVVFEGSLNVKPEDPFHGVIAKAKAKAELDPESSDGREKQHQLMVFRAMKNLAAKKGEKIPTFAEFSARLNEAVAAGGDIESFSDELLQERLSILKQARSNGAL